MHPPINREAAELIRRALESGKVNDEFLAAAEPFAIEAAWVRSAQKHRDFAAKFFARDPKSLNIFGAFGGNRSGKTYVGGWMCFALFVRECARDGDLFWCVAQNLERSVGGQQKELWESIPRGRLSADTRRWDPKIGFGAHRKIIISTKDGGSCVIEFRSADQDPVTFEQARLRGVWCDERCPETIYDRLLARIIDTQGFIILTDVRDQFWQEQRLFGDKTGRVHVVQFAMKDNLTLPAGAIQQALETMTNEEAAMRVYGNSAVMEGLVFKQYRPRHFIEPFPIPDYWPRWRVGDYGSSAPTAWLWIAVSEDEKKFVYREHYCSGMGIGHNARAVVAMSGNEEYRASMIDPHARDMPPAVYGMAPRVIDQYEAILGCKLEGWPYIQVMGEHACVEKMKFAFENDQLFVFNTCVKLDRELRSWKYKCGKDGKPLAVDAYENTGNHAIDATKGWLASNPTFTPRMIDVVR